MHNALSEGLLEDIQYDHGNKVNESWLLHHFRFDYFRPFVFLDDFAITTARPGRSATRTKNYVHNIQRAFYSDYLRQHGLMAKVVFLPIGILEAVFIYDLQQNDDGIQNINSLNDY